jgi:hypothetical protein
MDNIFLLAGLISLVFCIAKFVEMRFSEDEPKPLKIILRDALLVYMCVVVAYYLLEQVKPFTANVGGQSTQVFMDNPEF